MKIFILAQDVVTDKTSHSESLLVDSSELRVPEMKSKKNEIYML